MPVSPHRSGHLWMLINTLKTPELWGLPYIGFPFYYYYFDFTLFYHFEARKPEETCFFSAAHGTIYSSLRWNNGLSLEDQIWNGNSDRTHPGELQRVGAERGRKEQLRDRDKGWAPSIHCGCGASWEKQMGEAECQSFFQKKQPKSIFHSWIYTHTLLHSPDNV